MTKDIIKKLEPIVVLFFILLAPFYLKELWENLSWVKDELARSFLMLTIIPLGFIGYGIFKND